jgi:hypothetical protein
MPISTSRIIANYPRLIRLAKRAVAAKSRIKAAIADTFNSLVPQQQLATPASFGIQINVKQAGVPKSNVCYSVTLGGIPEDEALGAVPMDTNSPQAREINDFALFRTELKKAKSVKSFLKKLLSIALITGAGMIPTIGALVCLASSMYIIAGILFAIGLPIMLYGAKKTESIDKPSDPYYSKLFVERYKDKEIPQYLRKADPWSAQQLERLIRDFSDI